MKKNTNKYADLMLDRISQCIEEETKNLPAVSGAVVSSVNTDGTINVYFPPDNNKVFTNLSNQTPFLLEPGDSVELLLKDGSYNNCWIIAKHQTTFDGSTIAQNLSGEYATMDDLKKIQASLMTEIDPVFINSPAYTITPQQITQWNNAVVVQPATSDPVMDGVASVGSQSKYARGDHRHPTDTSRAPLAGPEFTGVPTAPTAAGGTNTEQIATTAFVQNALDNFSAPVTSVNNKTGAVVLDATDVGAAAANRTINGFSLTSDIILAASDVGALPDTTVVPVRTSQLTNDSGFITASSIPEEVFAVTYNGTTADKTFAQIRQASSDKKDCIVFYNNSIYVLEYSQSSYVVFSKSGTSGSGDNELGFVAYLVCTSADVWTSATLTLPSKTYVDNLVNSLGTVLNFQGTCSTVGDLPASGATGDVWIVTADSSEYVWDGSSWEKFGPTIDLSGYLQIANLADNMGNSTTTAMTQNATTQELNTKANVATTVSNVAYDTANKKITKTINGTTSDVVTIGTIKTDLNMTAADVGALPDDTDLTVYMEKGKDYVTAGKKNNTTLGSKATAEGENVTASGNYSHAEGSNTTASKISTHAEGYYTTASGNYSHAEGYYTTASGNYSHAEGSYTEASGAYSHTEGDATFASGSYSHAEGNYTDASGQFAHAEGNGTHANHRAQHVFGEHNILDNSAAAATARGNYVEIVGNGTSASARSNARTLDWNGNETLAGKLTVGSAPTNNMDVATKQYVDNITPVATSTTPIMDGTAAVGSETTWAKGDHVHPTDTTRAPLDSPALTGTPTAPTAATGSNTTQIATTEFVQSAIVAAGGGPSPSIANPLMDGTASAGTAAPYSREDHVHPTDTTRAPLASPALTGVPTAPTAVTGTDTTQIATTEFVNNSIAEIDALPPQSGNAGKVLSTNGTVASWIDNPEETFIATVGQTPFSDISTAALNENKKVYAVVKNQTSTNGQIYELVQIIAGSAYFVRTALSMGKAGDDPWTVSSPYLAGYCCASALGEDPEDQWSTRLALALSPLDSPAFTGTPTAPTPTSSSGNTQIATKEYVDTAAEPEIFIAAYGTETFANIRAAHTAGKIVFTINGSKIFRLIYCTDSSVVFVRNTGSINVEVVSVATDNTWTSETQNAQGLITASGILKGNGSGTISAAVAGTDYAAASHSHGNITSGGDMTATAAIASGDRLVINDESASKLVSSTITFGTATTTYLRNDGNWATPTNTTTGTTYAAASVPNNTTFGTNGSIYNVYNATKHGNITLTLNVANWNTSSKTISVTASGVTASNTVMVSPAPASTSVYSAAGVYCSAQGSNSLTFTCSSIPTAALTVNVVYFS